MSRRVSFRLRRSWLIVLLVLACSVAALAQPHRARVTDGYRSITTEQQSITNDVAGKQPVG